MSLHLGRAARRLMQAFTTRHNGLAPQRRSRTFARLHGEWLEDRRLLAADLSITKSAAPTLVAGASATYTIVASNAGPDPATAVIADTLPAGMTGAAFVSTAAGGATGNTLAGTGNINNAVTLPAGASITYTVTGTVSAAATGTLSNTATITATGTTVDANTANNSATVNSTLTSQADLQINKSNGASSVAAGGGATYVIVVSNLGPSAVTGATVADTFSADFTGATFTAVGTGGATGFANGSGNLNQVVNLPVGATITYTVNGTVSPTATSLSNTATVTAPAGVVDATLSNNTAVDTDTIAAATATTDLQITKTDNSASTQAGGTVTYTIVVRNAGATTVTGATVADTLPASLSGVTFTATSTGGATGFANGSGNLNQTLTLPAGATVTYTVAGTLAASASGSLANAATITAPAGTTDTNAGNNIAVDTNTIRAAAPDISITKTDNGDGSIAPGDNLTYTIIVNNTGTLAAQNVTITDVLPANTTFVSATTSGAPFALTTPTVGGTGTFSATSASLAAGASSTLTVVVNVNDTVQNGDVISNTATAVSTTIEPIQTNNTAVVDVDVVAEQSLECFVETLNLPGEPGTVILEDNADNPGTGVLIVTGTSRNDVIIVERRPGNSGELRVRMNNRTLGFFSAADAQAVVVFAGSGNDVVIVNAALTLDATLFGEAGNDKLFGARGDDGLDGGDGNDQLFGGAGNDVLCGGSGNDRVYGQGGDDIVGGDDGNDLVFGQGGNDLVLGGEGNDKVYGGAGNDQVFGQGGNDHVFGEAGADAVVGGEGNDRVFGGTGRDILIGGAGADHLFGEAGDDILISGSTTIDEDQDALFALLSDWNSSDSYFTRLDNLANGTGSSGLVFDDSALLEDDSADTLFGGGGQDLFLIGPGDRVRDRSRNEVVA